MTMSARIAMYCMLLLSWSAQAQTAPDALVKSTVDEVLAAIKQSRDKKTLNEIAERKVLPHFDFTAMTRLALGRYWREASDAQKKALEAGFRSLLVTTYVTALGEGANANRAVEVKPVDLKPGQDDVTVKTVTKEPGRQPIAIDYRMALRTNGWKVYDVVVENLSLITNYRGSFTAEITRSGIDGLIKTIEDKNRRLAQG